MSVHNTIIPVVAKGDFPSPIIRRMPYKSNLKELASYKAASPKENRPMIEHLIELYYNKKIPNYRTVEIVVARLLAKTTNDAIREKTLKGYKKVIDKYTDAMPTTGRIARQILEKERRF